VDQSGVDRKIAELIPGYMPMGSTGMGDMEDMGKPRNSLFMAGGDGPFGKIFMGGMFTILKVRAGLRGYDVDPGWFEHPPGTVAGPVGERAAVAVPSGSNSPRTSAGRLAPTGQTYVAVKAGSCASAMEKLNPHHLR
jgi:hypothetical protein